MHRTTVRRIRLKPHIPLALAPPETLRVDGAPFIPPNGSSPALADLDYDGKEDLVVLSPVGLRFHAAMGSGGPGGWSFATSSKVSFAPEVERNLASHLFVDWDNDGFQELLGSDSAGRVFLADMDTAGRFSVKTTLAARPGERCFPFVGDFDNDGRKDLAVQSAGSGISIYRNEGTDDAPALSSIPREWRDSQGADFTTLAGRPVWTALSGKGQDLLAWEHGRLRSFQLEERSGELSVVRRADVNLGGAALHCTMCTVAATLAEENRPKLLLFEPGKPARVFTGRLAGDFNGDGRVGSEDQVRLMNAWERRETDVDWDPRLNLALDPGAQRIDVKDLGIFADLWDEEE
jgi:hypothetical protein